MWTRKNVGAILALLVLGAMLTFAPSASAEMAKMSWKNPTTYTDNTAIPPDVMKKAWPRIYVGDGQNGPWTWVVSLYNTAGNPAPAEQHVFDAVVGKWYSVQFVVLNDLALGDIDSNKSESTIPPGVQFLLPAPPPPPPPPPPVIRIPAIPGRFIIELYQPSP